MKTLKKISSIFSWLVVLVVVIISGTLILSKFDTPVNIRVFSVLSGSMEPTIPTASVIIVQPQEKYEVGDIITVRSERTANETVTHRIASINEGEETKKLSYILKGDANEDEDSEPIKGSRVVGKVSFHVPVVGKVVAFAQTQTGFVTLVVVPATILIYSELTTIKNEIIKLIKKRKNKKKLLKEKKDEE